MNIHGLKHLLYEGKVGVCSVEVSILYPFRLLVLLRYLNHLPQSLYHIVGVLLILLGNLLLVGFFGWLSHGVNGLVEEYLDVFAAKLRALLSLLQGLGFVGVKPLQVSSKSLTHLPVLLN